MRIEKSEDPSQVLLFCDTKDNWLVQGAIGVAYDRSAKCWQVPIAQNVEFLRSFKKSQFSPGSLEDIRAVVYGEGLSRSIGPMLLAGNAMDHQVTALGMSLSQKCFMFAHAMGAGKTYTMLMWAANLHKYKGLQNLLVICPATIKRDVWEPQIGQWLTGLITYEHHVVYAGKYKHTEHWLEMPHQGCLKIMVVGIQALSGTSKTDRQSHRKILVPSRTTELCQRFLKSGKSAIALDESSKIKNADSNRTKVTIQLGKLADYRCAGTGTKITQGVHDLYPQYCFLDWSILGHKSYQSFKAQYCVMGGFEGRQIIGYRHINELMRSIAPYTHIIRKQDANQLPPKTYMARTVEPTKEMAKMYEDLTNYMEATHDGECLTVNTVLERMTRYQQLAGGNFPYKGEDGEWKVKPLKNNPKLAELLDTLQEIGPDAKVLIWARFDAEIDAIVSSLVAEYGPESVVQYHGRVSTDARAEAKRRIREDPECRFMVLNQQTGCMGITVVEATYSIYYSNSFSLEERVQSEDRNHRTGQKNAVTYIDLYVNLPIDDSVRKSIEKKKSMATFVADTMHDRQVLDMSQRT